MPIQFSRIELNGAPTNRAYVTWSKGGGGATASFEVRYKIGNANFNAVIPTTNTAITIDGIDPGRKLLVQVRGVGVGFPVKKSTYATATAIAPSFGTDDNNTNPTVNVPEDVRNVRFQRMTSTTGMLQWDRAVAQSTTDLILHIRHSAKTDGTGTITDSVKVAQVPASTDTLTIPSINGEYLLRYQDRRTGLYSATAVSVVVNLPDTAPSLLIETRREDQDVPPFQGEKTGVFYSEEYDGLVLDGDETIDDVLSETAVLNNLITQSGNQLITQSGDSLTFITIISGGIDGLSTIDFVGTRLLAGHYDFPNVLDLGGKFEVQFQRTLVSRGLYPSDLIDDRSELVDRWETWDGDAAESTSAEVFFRASDQQVVDFNVLLQDGTDAFLLEDGDKLNQESTISFGPFTPLTNGTYVGRTFQFRAELESEHTDETPLVDELGYTLTIPSRTESSGTIASGAAAKAVTFANAFYEAPSVGVTAFNLASGDYYEVTSVTRTGFTVHFKDSSNSSVDRNFQFVAAGFGSEQT